MDSYKLQKEDALPPRWSWATVEQIGEVVTGFTPPKSEARFFGGSIPLFKPTDLNSGYFVTEFRDSLTEEGARLGRLLPPLSVLVTCIGATIGKTGLTRVGSATNQQINAVVVDQRGVLPQWLYWVFKSPAGQRQIIDNASATTLPILNKSRFQKLRIPVAPYEEQGRIVNEIEKHFSRLDAAVDALKRVRANLKRYRASVLKSACEGRLVPTEAKLARAEGRDYEPADVLLERILSERRAKWEAEELSKTTVKGNSSKDDRRRSRYREPAGRDPISLPKLPEGWRWTALEYLAWQAGYGTSVKCDYTYSGIPVLRIPNIEKGEIDVSDLKFALPSPKLEVSRHLAWGDLLVIRTNGSRALIGRGALVKKSFDPPHSFASYLIRFRLVPSITGWLAAIWESPRIRVWIEHAAATSAGQYNINLRALNSLPLPIPPASEQQRIISEVERRLSVIGEIEVQVDANLKRAERLRQSILKWAFEGKLAPQDSSDEDASVLLERIRADRISAGANAISRLGGEMKRKRSRRP